MKFSTRTRYGLRLLTYLAAEYDQNVPIRLREIATSEGISAKYLEQIIIILKRHKMLNITRGVKGGYRLALHPGKVNLFTVFTALEGGIEPVLCVREEKDCLRKSVCAINEMWRDLHHTIKTFLQNKTLLDLADAFKKKEPIYKDFIKSKEK